MGRRSPEQDKYFTQEIAKDMNEGVTLRETYERLRISKATVVSYRKKIRERRKLGAVPDATVGIWGEVKSEFEEKKKQIQKAIELEMNILKHWERYIEERVKRVGGGRPSQAKLPISHDPRRLSHLIKSWSDLEKAMIAIGQDIGVIPKGKSRGEVNNEPDIFPRQTQEDGELSQAELEQRLKGKSIEEQQRILAKIDHRLTRKSTNTGEEESSD